MGFGDYLAQGGFHITGDRRDPKSRLGRANPNSWHNQGQLYDKGFGAYDVRPREGMTFEQFRDQVKADGWNVREAIDEVNHPSAHATGPHWHMAVDGRKESAPMANTLADLMKGVYPMAQQEQQAMQQQPTSLASLLPMDTPLQQNRQPEQLSPVALPDSITGKRPLWKDILGTAFDFMWELGGQGSTYWPGVQADQQQRNEGLEKLREHMAAAAQKQADRQATLQDWMFQQQYKAGNPEPSAMERDLATWNSWSPEQRGTYATMQDVRSPIAVSRPDGSVVRVPRDFGQPGAGGGDLRADAEAAIAAGANPETVWARYRQMGGQ